VPYSDRAALLTCAYNPPYTTAGLVPAGDPPYPRTMRNKTCKVCLVEHDEEIHAATLSLRQWLRQKVTSALRPDEPAEETRPAA
jgi:hypothetical protein